jgi:TonB family protein
MDRHSWIVAALVVVCSSAAAQTLPEYSCHPLQEGRGDAVERKVEQRINAARTLPPNEAISELESLAEDARSKGYLAGVLSSELAWQYLEAGRPEEAAARAHAALQNVYLEGARIDQMRGVLAQIEANAGRWDGVVEALQPVADRQCRSVPAVFRYLLAEAHIRRGDVQAALIQIDAAQPQDTAEGLQWMRTALALDCAEAPGVACAVRVLRYAQTPGPSAGLQALVDEHLKSLAGIAELRPRLEQAHEAGLLDADFRLIPRSPSVVDELRPLKRIAPKYPREALLHGQQGYVELEITVDRNGDVINARVVDSAPPGVFDRAALAAAWKGSFQPRIVDGQPAETTGRYVVQFKLDP